MKILALYTLIYATQQLLWLKKKLRSFNLVHTYTMVYLMCVEKKTGNQKEFWLPFVI